MKCKMLLLALLSIASMPVYAGNPHSEILADKMLSTANHRLYPAPDSDAVLPAAPQGYVPFHISTYARHGSRYLISQRDYERALAPMLKAANDGVLTSTGEIVKERLEKIRCMAEEGRYGELTPAGAAQHRGIANRMYRNFPEIFEGEVKVRARSTDVMRCAMSMMAECLELQRLNPQLIIDHDASRADLNVLNDYVCADSLRKAWRPERLAAVKSQKEKLDASRLMPVLFSDAQWVKENIDNTKECLWNLFFVASNMQSHSDPDLDLMWVFTPEECYRCWLVNNVEWYMMVGNTPLTDYRMPRQQVNLLRDFIADSDKFVQTRERGATLRFGHESVLIPTVVPMGINNYDYSTDNLETLHEHWADYEIFPMAANLQFVFYRNPEDPAADVLVRVMLNEEDVRLPVDSFLFPFYKWSEVRAHLYRSAN